MSSIQTHRYQRGVVSLFVVIFSALLISVLTIGFIRLMIQEGEQATNSDLSQSAYDSAVAGVEDGKRVLRACQQGSTAACNAIAAQKCSTISDAGIVGASPTETTIKGQGSSDTSLNQAYTCVKITSQTSDVVAELTGEASKVVRLRAAAPFNQITVEWMMRGKAGGDPRTLEAPTTGLPIDSLPPKTQWSSNAPSLLRAEPVLPKDPNTVSRADLDSNIVATYFLRPASINDPATMALTPAVGSMPRAAGAPSGISSPSPIAVTCSQTLYQDNSYACKAQIPVSYDVPAESSVAILRLTSLYRDTSVRVTLSYNGTPVKFDGVQPSIDSTGRASDVFRRIVSRVEQGVAGTTTLPYPENAVDITGSLCKDFSITDVATDAASAQGCKPTPTPPTP